ncbi:MAG: ureidoglycolate lyase [Crocosphaera sp.]|nr:ureidoglycolate lyase [Crocosphaera sp.]
MTSVTTVKSLALINITTENFKPYGQLITPSEDGKVYDETDAQLHLENGIPRFYIMRLEQRGRQFHRITRHQQCTQCLGSLEGKEWLMAVAPPGVKDYPDITQLKAFTIPGNCFIKLEVGTWHAGPYFDHEFVDFYNLELSNTNVIDHFTYNFLEKDNLRFEMVS